MQVTAERLLRDAQNLAVAILLVRAAPAEGRHDFLLDVAGALFRANRDAAARIHHAVASEILGDRYNREEGDRLLAETAGRIARNDPACGWPRLIERIGKNRARKIGEWLGHTPGPDVTGPWPEPIDILADPELTGIGDRRRDCLPESILALARAEGARLQVDPCHIAALTIGACSAVISDDWRVRLKVRDTSWIQHPSIWVAVVAASGSRKTDCFRSATRGIARIEAKVRETYQRDLARHLEEHKAWEAQAKEERGPKPKEPVEPRLATDDFTIDALSDILQTSSKVLLRSDELATMLGAYERYRNRAAIAGRAHAWRSTTVARGASIACSAARCSSRTGRPCPSAISSRPRSATWSPAYPTTGCCSGS